MACSRQQLVSPFVKLTRQECQLRVCAQLRSPRRAAYHHGATQTSKASSEPEHRIQLRVWSTLKITVTAMSHTLEPRNDVDESNIDCTRCDLVHTIGCAKPQLPPCFLLASFCHGSTAPTSVPLASPTMIAFHMDSKNEVISKTSDTGGHNDYKVTFVDYGRTRASEPHHHLGSGVVLSLQQAVGPGAAH